LVLSENYLVINIFRPLPKSCGFASGGAGPPQVAIDRASGGTPDKPEFPAQPEMRPDEKPPVSVSILQVEAL
jgi:hypothetical protein